MTTIDSSSGLQCHDYIVAVIADDSIHKTERYSFVSEPMEFGTDNCAKLHICFPRKLFISIDTNASLISVRGIPGKSMTEKGDDCGVDSKGTYSVFEWGNDAYTNHIDHSPLHLISLMSDDDFLVKFQSRFIDNVSVQNGQCFTLGVDFAEK